MTFYGSESLEEMECRAVAGNPLLPFDEKGQGAEREGTGEGKREQAKEPQRKNRHEK